MNAPTAGLLLDERYELLAAAQDRGVGLSFRARDRQQGGREVLVKFLRPMPGEPPPALLEALRGLRAFRHERVPALFRTGATADRHWLAYELVAGDSLGTLLDGARGGAQPLALGVLRAIADAVVAALAAAHTAPLAVLHGTLTPGSVVARLGDDGAVRVHLLDLGIAEYAEAPADAPARSARTLVTAAPERYAGQPATVATDVFALGALLRELFATPPKLGHTLSAVGFDRQRPDVPRAVWDVLAHAMQLAPAARIESVAAMQAMLAAAWDTARDAAPVEAPSNAPAAPRPRSLLEATGDFAGDVLALKGSAPARPPAAPTPFVLAPPPASAPAPALSSAYAATVQDFGALVRAVRAEVVTPAARGDAAAPRSSESPDLSRTLPMDTPAANIAATLVIAPNTRDAATVPFAIGAGTNPGAHDVSARDRPASAPVSRPAPPVASLPAPRPRSERGLYIALGAALLLLVSLVALVMARR